MVQNKDEHPALIFMACSLDLLLKITIHAGYCNLSLKPLRRRTGEQGKNIYILMECNLQRVFEGGLLIKHRVWGKTRRKRRAEKISTNSGRRKKLGVCELCLRGVERAGACCIIKTSPTPSQLCCTQNCRNEGTMNGFHCVTMTAAFSGKATVRGLSCRDAAPSVCVCLCACVHWEITQECEDTCQRQRICILLALWRNITIPSKSLSRQPHWIELIKVLWSAKDAFSFPADAKGELLGLCDMAWNFNFLSSYTFTGFKKIYL